MLIVELLLEEPSAEVALVNLFPKIRGDLVIYPHVFQGKQDLLEKLPNRLAAYSNWITKDYRIVVLIDEDREDCIDLKQSLEDEALRVGLISASVSSQRGNRGFVVLNRIAIEELEAWFFGDVAALSRAYPRIPGTLGEKASYRDPDAIKGGTWEALEKVFQRYGYYKGGLPKIEVAKKVSGYMDPEINKSKSFQIFRDGLRKL